jgi:hypothetical protein
MIGSALGRIAMADRMSVDQLKEALQNKTLPAYIAIPLIEEKMDMQDRMRSSAAAQQARPQPPIAEQVMQRAEAAGIDRLPTNLTPTRKYAGGGIVAFGDGGEVPRYANTGLVEPEFKTTDPAKINQAKLDILRAELAEEQRNLGVETDPTKKARIQTNITALNREIAAVSKSPSPETSMKGFGKVATSNDPGIAAQRTATPQGQAASTMTPQQMVTEARGITNLIYPATGALTEMTPEKAFEQTDKFMTMAGFDRDIFKKQGKDVAEERAGIAKDREEAKTFRILEAAAGVLSGTSPFAAVNIGKGTAPAVQGLAADMKEFQKNERALRAAERDLTMAEQKFNLTRASGAEAQMIRAQDRVDKYTKEKAGLTNDLVKSFVSVQGQKEVAQTYTEGNKELQRIKELGTPDVVKSLNTLASQLRTEDPKLTVQQSLQAAASLLKPERTTNATIGAVSKVRQDVDKAFNELTLMNPTYKALRDKAAKGDADAQKQLDAKKDAMFLEGMQRLENAMPGVFGVTPPPSTGDTENAPPKPTSLPTNAPPGSVFGRFVPGMGWEIKDKSGNLIGYGQ